MKIEETAQQVHGNQTDHRESFLNDFSKVIRSLSDNDAVIHSHTIEMPLYEGSDRYSEKNTTGKFDYSISNSDIREAFGAYCYDNYPDGVGDLQNKINEVIQDFVASRGNELAQLTVSQINDSLNESGFVRLASEFFGRTLTGESLVHLETSPMQIERFTRKIVDLDDAFELLREFTSSQQTIDRLGPSPNEGFAIAAIQLIRDSHGVPRDEGEDRIFDELRAVMVA